MASDFIDLQRLLDLRPAGVRNRLFPDEEILPYAPAVLLPKLGAPLLELPVSLGALLEPALRAASGKDTCVAIGLDAEAGPSEPGPRGLHASVDKALEAVRAAAYRLPFVLHARLGMVDGDDEHSVDVTRIKVLEALDAGVTSVQLGAFGDPESAAKLLVDVLRPVGEYGIGLVVQLADSYQVEGLPPLLGSLEVDAFATSSPNLRRREAIAVRPVAPLPLWADAAGPVLTTVKAALKEGSFELLPPGERDRVEMKVFNLVEDLVDRLKAGGSAGRAMVGLSATQEAWPDPE